MCVCGVRYKRVRACLEGLTGGVEFAERAVTAALTEPQRGLVVGIVDKGKLLIHAHGHACAERGVSVGVSEGREVDP